MSLSDRSAAEIQREAAGHQQAGRLDQAERLYREALRLAPDSAEAANGLGSVLLSQGRLEEAEAPYRATIRLRPDAAVGYANLGNLLRLLGRAAEAEGYCRQAAALRPDSPEAHNNLGNALVDLDRLAEAESTYKEALRLQPRLPEVHKNLGNVLLSEGRVDEAASCFEAALSLRPDYAEARVAACVAKLPVLYLDEAEIAKRRREYERCLAALARDVERRTAGDLADAIASNLPYFLPYQGYNDRDLQRVHGAMMCGSAAARYPTPELSVPAAGEKLRIGIVSGFFRQHSNWKARIKGWLTQFDRQRFRIFGYHTGVRQDDVTRQAAALCERFVQGPLGVVNWRTAILADAPHVLIYPEVGMDPVAAQLAAQRLARVQCSSWGHPETSGFPTVDYFLSSDLMEPADGEQHYTEQLVRLPNLGIYYEPDLRQAPPASRADLGLRPNATVYWCAQAIYKYLPQYDSVFPRIAREVGDCQFVFIEFPRGRHATDLFRQRLERAFAAFGLKAGEHCVVLPRLSEERYAAASAACDVVLDSIGWSGCNSTLESLAGALPIVTFPTSLMRGRHSAAILERMGLRDTIAKSLDDYVAIAVRLGSDRGWRAELAKRIAANRERVYRDRLAITALEDLLERAARTSPPSARSSQGP